MKLLRTLVLNRFFAAAAALAITVGAINLYVASNDEGILSGQVADVQGKPVAGAEVILFMPALIGLDEIDRQTTDETGAFEFRAHGQHHPALQVQADGFEDSDLRRVRLYFRNQNRSLDTPIVIGADTNEG